MRRRGGDASRLFPPRVVAEVKALACQLPRELGLPLSRLSREDLRRLVLERGIVESISGTTIWRWLSRTRSGPGATAAGSSRATRSLPRRAGGARLLPASSRASGSARTSTCSAPTRRPRSKRACGAIGRPRPRLGGLPWSSTSMSGAVPSPSWAALDLHRPCLIGRCEEKSGIAPFDRLVEQVMLQAPFCCANRVFLIVDNGSSHRGAKSVERLEGRWPNLRLIHLPIHASWLNQFEIYFSILQRKLLQPQRLPRPDQSRAVDPRLRVLLRRDRRAVRVALHPRRPRPAARPDHQRADRLHTHSAAPARGGGTLNCRREH